MESDGIETPGQSAGLAPSPAGRLAAAGVLFALLACAGAWLSGLLSQAFDFDEVMHAHTIWQISVGLTPFHDFYECHPPFVWYAFVPFFSLGLPEGPDALFGLRVLSGLATFVGLAIVTRLLVRDRPQLSVAASVAGFALVIASPLVLDYVLQFRVDTIATTLLFASFAVHRAQEQRSPFVRHATLGLLASLAILASPKLYALPIAYATIEMVRGWRSGALRGPGFVRMLLGYGVGIGAAIAMGLVFLALEGIDPVVVWDLAIRFHLLFGARAVFARGVLEEVLAQPALLGLIVGGVCAWIVWLVRSRATPTSFEAAAALTAIHQLLTVPYPHVQYVAPFFLLGAVFLAYIPLALEQVLGERSAGRVQRWAPLVASVAVVIFSQQAVTRYSGLQGAAQLAQVHETILALTPPTDRILVPAPFNPIVRHDALYGVIHSWSPNGVTTEDLLREMDVAPYSEMRSEAHYRAELESNPPAVILFTGRQEFFYSPAQTRSIASFLADHADLYRTVVGLRPMLHVRTDLIPPGPHSADPALASSQP